MKDWLMELCPEIAEWQAEIIAEQVQREVAAEREACAKVCDDRVTAYRYATDSWAQEHIDEARYLSAAIRARSEA